MKQFYVRTPATGVKYFGTVPEVVVFLESFVRSNLNHSRKSWMQSMIELGHGYDDPTGKTFTETLNQYVETGTVRSDGKHVRCNIHESITYRKPEFGD
jgi:hypothetical protein